MEALVTVKSVVNKAGFTTTLVRSYVRAANANNGSLTFNFALHERKAVLAFPYALSMSLDGLYHGPKEPANTVGDLVSHVVAYYQIIDPEVNESFHRKTCTGRQHS